MSGHMDLFSLAAEPGDSAPLWRVRLESSLYALLAVTMVVGPQVFDLGSSLRSYVVAGSSVLVALALDMVNHKRREKLGRRLEAAFVDPDQRIDTSGWSLGEKRSIATVREDETWMWWVVLGAMMVGLVVSMAAGDGVLVPLLSILAGAIVGRAGYSALLARTVRPLLSRVAQQQLALLEPSEDQTSTPTDSQRKRWSGIAAAQ